MQLPIDFTNRMKEMLGEEYEAFIQSYMDNRAYGLRYNPLKINREEFEAALANDINTSSAITVIYDVLRSEYNDATKLQLIRSFDEVLSLNLTRMQGEQESGIDAELESYILAKIEERKNAKKEKDFDKADAIRDELAAKGIRIKDTREGVRWKRA